MELPHIPLPLTSDRKGKELLMALFLRCVHQRCFLAQRNSQPRPPIPGNENSQERGCHKGDKRKQSRGLCQEPRSTRRGPVGRDTWKWICLASCRASTARVPWERQHIRDIALHQSAPSVSAFGSNVTSRRLSRLRWGCSYTTYSHSTQTSPLEP